jgi:hypothetical protein
VNGRRHTPSQGRVQYRTKSAAARIFLARIADKESRRLLELVARPQGVFLFVGHWRTGGTGRNAGCSRMPNNIRACYKDSAS